MIRVHFHMWMVVKSSDDTVAGTTLSAGGDNKAKILSRSQLGVLEEQQGGQCGWSREREGQERKMSEEMLMVIKTWTLALRVLSREIMLSCLIPSCFE